MLKSNFNRSEVMTFPLGPQEDPPTTYKSIFKEFCEEYKTDKKYLVVSGLFLLSIFGLFVFVLINIRD